MWENAQALVAHAQALVAHALPAVTYMYMLQDAMSARVCTCMYLAYYCIIISKVVFLATIIEQSTVCSLWLTIDFPAACLSICRV